jgi:hypothetical protein
MALGKKEFATLIDAYADAKVTGNKYLVDNMIAQIEKALNEVFDEDENAEELFE